MTNVDPIAAGLVWIVAIDYALIEHLLRADPAQLTEVSCYVQ